MSGIRRAVAMACLSAVAVGCNDAFLVDPPANLHRHWWTGFASQGLSNQGYALVEHEGALYAGGLFLRAGETTVNGVARWDGTSWTPLANGVRRRDCTNEFCNATVNALVSWEGDLVAAGHFTVAGGTPSLSVARWNGTRWDAFGSGLNGDVYALAVYRGALVAGGSFVAGGDGTPLPYLATWLDGAWTPLGGGADDVVRALAVSGDELIAGGDFQHVGTVPARRLARWDGGSWAAMAQENTFGEVRGLMTAGGSVIANGMITVRERESWYQSRVAQWNGEAWTSVGDPSGEVHAVCAFGGTLFAAVRVSLLRTALHRLQGGRWVPVSTVVDGEVRALQGHGGHLFVAGTFTAAGDRRSPFIARWDE